MFFALLRRFWPAALLVFALVVAGATHLVQARFQARQMPVYKVSVGQKLVYALSYDNSINADLSGLMPPPQTTTGQPRPTIAGLQQTVKSRLGGKWIAVVVEQSETQRVLACHLEDADLSLRSGEAELVEEAARIESDLERPFWVCVTPQGAVIDVRFAPQMSNNSRGFARALLGLWQFVAPEKTPAKSGENWETTESDTAGRYLARYDFAPDDAIEAAELAATEGAKNDAANANAGLTDESGSLFSKTKTRYLPATSTAATEAAPANEVTSHMRLLARFDRGVVQAMRGWEKQTTSLAERDVAQSQTNVAFRLIESATVDEATLKSLQNENADSEKTGEARALFEAPDADEMRQATRQNTLGEDSLGSLLSELAKSQKSGQTGDVKLYVKFRALAEVQPNSCVILGKLLEVAPAESLTFRLVSEALSAAKSDAAQAALVSATRKRSGDIGALQTLIPALGMSAQPSQGTQNVLSELARSHPDAGVASTAQLALGNLARSLAPTAPARSTQIVDDLTRQLRAARSDAACQQLLLTLGNTGSARALAVLRDYSKSSNAVLRATAVNSLRFIVGADAENLLLQALSRDPSAEVRLNAVQALNFRPMNEDTFAVQKKALQTDADQNVRLALLNTLWSANYRPQEVTALVAQIARNDASPDVKKAAAQLSARTQSAP